MNGFQKRIWLKKTKIIYGLCFKSIGKGALIYKPLQLDSVSSISLGDSVYIAQGAWLIGNKEEQETIIIGANTTIGHYAHIVGLHSVKIEDNVLIADRVYISDCTHSYQDLSIPIIEQEVIELSSVVIGEGSWLGENVCVCGASIGKHCVIGANSVVTTNIPDFSVAVGSPAKVTKKYDFHQKEWVKV